MEAELRSRALRNAHDQYQARTRAGCNPRRQESVQSDDDWIEVGSVGSVGSAFGAGGKVP